MKYIANETFTEVNITIPENPGYSCAYTIEVPKYTFEIESTLNLWLLSTQNDVWFYRGGSRANLTEVIREGGRPHSGGGAPFEVNVSDSATVVIWGVGNTAIAFQVTGSRYPWWEQPFLGEPLWSYYLGVYASTLAVTILLIVLPLFLGINLCCACLTGTTYSLKQLKSRRKIRPYDSRQQRTPRRKTVQIDETNATLRAEHPTVEESISDDQYSCNRDSRRQSHFRTRNTAKLSQYKTTQE